MYIYVSEERVGLAHPDAHLLGEGHKDLAFSKMVARRFASGCLGSAKLMPNSFHIQKHVSIIHIFVSLLRAMMLLW